MTTLEEEGTTLHWYEEGELVALAVKVPPLDGSEQMAVGPEMETTGTPWENPITGRSNRKKALYFFIRDNLCTKNKVNPDQKKEKTFL